MADALTSNKESSSPVYEATITHTPEILRRGIWQFWIHHVGWRFAAIAFLWFYFVALTVIGDRSWKVGVLGTVSIFTTLMCGGVYVTYRRRAMSTMRRMQSPTSHMTFSSSGLSQQSELGSATIPWQRIIGVRRFGDFWLMYLSKTNFFTLPLANVNFETQEFILAQVAKNGGRVK